MPDEDRLSYRILNGLFQVHRELGPGFLERLYHDAVEMALSDRGIAYQSEVPFVVRYMGRPLRTQYRADLVCEGQVLLELKAQRTIGPVEHAQVINYLKASQLPVGLLVNFGEDSLVVRRFVGGNYREELHV